MARIRGKDTGPEVALRRALWQAGLRYRLGMRVEGTRPDLTFPRARLVVFVDGCFWHGCPLHYVRPRTKEEFWALKLAVNTDRDRRQTVLLRDLAPVFPDPSYSQRNAVPLMGDWRAWAA